MEQVPLPAYQPNDQPSAEESPLDYPPKYVKEDEKGSSIWLRSAGSLVLYLVLGYLIFKSFSMLLLLTAIAVIHELGHFLAMKSFRYRELGIFFIPLLGAYVSGSKRDVSQKESAIVLMAGPLPGIIIGAIMYIMYQSNSDLEIAGISFYTISLSFLFLNLINLLPVYPLDGGQLLNRVFLDEESWVSKGFIFLSAAFLIWVALFAFTQPMYVLLVFPAMMLMRMFGDSKINSLEKRIEQEGINLDISYEDLTDKDYWRIRNILVSEHPTFRDFNQAPPYEYSEKEEKIMTTIQSLLHRHLIQDLTLLGKLVVALIWILAFLSPWLIDVDLSFLRRFGL